MSIHDLRWAWELTVPAAMGAAEDADYAMMGVEDVAQMLGMSKIWVYKKFTAENPPMKFGNISKWYRWQVLAYMDARHRAAIGGRR